MWQHPTVDEREVWDRRYRRGEYVPRAYPSPFLLEWLKRIPTGLALDVACGAGRNSFALAEAGFSVEAIDISGAAIDMAQRTAAERSLSIDWHVGNLSEFDPPAATYDLITVFRYRDPHLWPRLIESLAPDAWILVEHHMKTTLDVAGPSTPEFRLDPQELLHAFDSLRIVHYSEQVEPADQSDRQYVIARIAACNGDPGW